MSYEVEYSSEATKTLSMQESDIRAEIERDIEDYAANKAPYVETGAHARHSISVRGKFAATCVIRHTEGRIIILSIVVQVS